MWSWTLLSLVTSPNSTPHKHTLPSHSDIGHTVSATHKAHAQDKLSFQVPIGLSACALKR